MYPDRVLCGDDHTGKIGKIRLVIAEYLTDNLAVSNDELGGNMAWRIDGPKVAGRSTSVGDIGEYCAAADRSRNRAFVWTKSRADMKC